MIKLFVFLREFYFPFLRKKILFFFSEQHRNVTLQETDRSLKIDNSDTSVPKLKASRNAARARNRFYFCTAGAYFN